MQSPPAKFPPPTPRPGRAPYRRRLTSLDAVRKELAQCYHLAREGALTSADASRLASVLGLLGRFLEGAELEQRLEALERSAGSSWR